MVSIKARELRVWHWIEVSWLHSIINSWLEPVAFTQWYVQSLFGVHIEVAEAKCVATIWIGKPAIIERNDILPSLSQRIGIEIIEA
mgnify:CR=1 FL=1